MHDAVGNQAGILAMIQQWQIEHPGVFGSPAHHLAVLHAMAIVSNGHHSGLLQRSHRRQFLARESLGDGPGDKHIHLAIADGNFPHVGNRAGVIDGRHRIGHADHRCKPAPGRRRRAGSDGFLGRLARLA